MRQILPVFFGMLLFLSSLAFADDERPRIGLVLGGGGARGSAHIGVLKVLEEYRIPIDYIAGTSMGAIVGGGYAAGLSPQQIEKILLNIDWKDLLSDDPIRRDMSVRDKLDRRKFLPMEIGVGPKGLTLPQGAIQGQKLEFILESMMIHQAGVERFDELPIPFRSLATDIVSGEEVVLENGNLSHAIRASMAVPGIFSPVEVDGRLLVDGGVVNNVPVDIVKAMGADILIVVDVGYPLAKKEDLSSFVSIMNQTANILTQRSVREQLRKLSKNDLLIQPTMPNLSVANFDRVDRGIVAGEKAARAVSNQLSRYSVTRDSYDKFLRRQRQENNIVPPIDFIEIVNLKRITEETVLAKIETKIGKPLNLEVLQRDLTRIHSLGDFEKVGFRIVERAGKRGVVIDAQEKSWGPNYLHFGVNAGTNLKEDSFYNVMGSLKMTELNFLGAEWKNELQAGQTSRIFSEYYQPLEESRTFFFAPGVEWRQDVPDVYKSGQRIAEYRTRRLGAGGDLGVNFGTAAELRGGLFWGTIDAEPSTGDASLPEFDISRAAARILFTYDQLDKVFFPKNGLRVTSSAWLEMDALGAENSYEKYDISGYYAKTLGKWTLIAGGNYGISPDNNVPFYDEYTLGGFLNLSGFRSDELRGPQRASLQFITYYQILDQLASVLQGVYIGGSLEGGNVWQDFDDMDVSDFVIGGSAFIGVETFVGPLYLGYGYNEESGDGELYIYLGQIF